MARTYLLAELAALLEAELIGDPQQEISALATLQTATANDLTFIANPAYKKYLPATSAGAVLIHPDLIEEFAGNKLVVKKPYVAYAKATKLFDLSNAPFSGIHPTAVIGVNCLLGSDISVGANAVLGDGVKLGDGVVVGPGCYIGDDSVIGNNTKLAAKVSIYHGVSIGSDCRIHSCAVIGADGFGFAPDAGEWVKIHQLGGVVIGNNVEIGACTCIDRGALDNTYIADGVIIDNQVQIAHNVSIGKGTAIAAQTGIAGTTSIGEYCTIAGAVGIVGHLTITDRVHITAMSLVTGSITESGSYSSGTALGPTKEWRKNAARFRQLDKLATRLIKLDRNSSGGE